MLNNRIALALLPPFWPNLPPLNLAILKAYLHSRGIITDIFDYNNTYSAQPGREREIAEKLLCYNIVGFSCYRSNFETTLKVSRILKEKEPGIKIIFGGPEIASQYFKFNGALAEKYGQLANLLVVGEGELPLSEYLTISGTNEHVAVFRELETLENFPLPDYSGLDFNRYSKKGAVSLLYSRGCIRRCRFCSERLLYKKYRCLPAENIVEQIRRQQEAGRRSFIFHDSMLNGNLQGLENLCDQLIEKFGSVNWEAQIAIRNDMPEHLLIKMKQSGCYHLFVGLESGSNRTLAAMNKGYTKEEAAEFFRILKAAGLSFGISMITGFPGESEADFRESLDFVIRNKDIIPKIEQVNPFVYYEGTDLPREADYRLNPQSVARTEQFIMEIKHAGLKYTKAFVMNLLCK